MEVTPTCLDLTISMAGFASSSPPSSEGVVGHGLMKNLDINRVPSGEWEEEWTVGSMELDDDDGNNYRGPPRRKLRLTKQQSRLLEESFRHNHILSLKQKESLAMQLKLRPRQVEVWFQNRRARSKLKQTEIECEYLKRCYGSLTEQNRRLQKEVEELRAMKVGQPRVISHNRCDPLPASTLSMCPRCQHVTTLDKGHASTSVTKPTTLSSKVPANLPSSFPTLLGSLLVG